MQLQQLNCCLCLTFNCSSFDTLEGKFGRLGHNSESNCLVPRQVESLFGKNPTQISCGGFHTAVVTEDGHLYTFGGGEHGQLGHNDRVNKLKPTLVQALDDVFISQITCGWSHSVALDVKGRVYTWGNSDHGKLGHGSSRKVAVPQIVDKLKDYRVVRVASYNEHTSALVDPSFLGGTGSSAVNAVPVTAAYTSQIRALVNDDEFSDVTFMIQNESIYAHRAILAQRCSHFAAMFRRYVHCVKMGCTCVPIWRNQYV
jgi:RCC1 and BTB domain-containing protein